MLIKPFKALWGMQGDLESMFKQIAESGYVGIESPLPSQEDSLLFKELLEKYSLDYIAMVFTQGATSEEHLNSYEEQLNAAAAFNPLHVTAHSSRDFHSLDMKFKFYENALIAEKQAGVLVGHETHRGRAMFTPWGTAELLRAFPELKITSDFSHWVCVCESLLSEQQDSLMLAMERTVHIHARVGYTQGPQVPHPAAPEYQNELNLHEEWWKMILKLRMASGYSQTTFTPEFGPADSRYLHTLPFTDAPVADLWQVCLWMKDRFTRTMSNLTN